MCIYMYTYIYTYIYIRIHISGSPVPQWMALCVLLVRGLVQSGVG